MQTCAISVDFQMVYTLSSILHAFEKCFEYWCQQRILACITIIKHSFNFIRLLNSPSLRNFQLQMNWIIIRTNLIKYLNGSFKIFFLDVMVARYQNYQQHRNCFLVWMRQGLRVSSHISFNYMSFGS